MRAILSLTLVLFFTACAVKKEGLLIDSEPGTAIEESDLKKHCDLGDQAACDLASSSEPVMLTNHFPIIQGVAPSDRAVFAVLHPRSTKLSWFIYNRDISQLNKLFIPKPVTTGNSQWALQRLDVRYLEPGRTYELLAGDSEGKLVERRRFRTLSLDEKNIKIGVIGGLGFLDKEKSKQVEQQILAQQPQMILLLGGNVHISRSQETSKNSTRAVVKDFFFEQHVLARSLLPLALEPSLTPVISLWNESEFGQDYGGRSFSYRDQAREVLELFFPYWADEKNIIDGPGLAKNLYLGNLSLLLLDNLSFRSPELAPAPICEKKRKGKKLPICHLPKPIINDPNLLFGKIQTSWISQQARKSGRPTWLLTSGPWLYAYRPDWIMTKTTFPENLPGSWLALIQSTEDSSLQVHFMTLGSEHK